MQPLPYSESCFVCGHENEAGLRLRFFRDGATVRCRCTLDDHYRGFLDRTHGGILATLVDETMGWATVVAANRFTYTVELNVRFRLPVAVGEPLDIAAWVNRHTRRLSYAEAEIRNSTGDILVSAQGKFMVASAEETESTAGLLLYDPGAWRFEDATVSR